MFLDAMSRKEGSLLGPEQSYRQVLQDNLLTVIMCLCQELSGCFTKELNSQLLGRSEQAELPGRDRNSMLECGTWYLPVTCGVSWTYGTEER